MSRRRHEGDLRCAARVPFLDLSGEDMSVIIVKIYGTLD